VRNRRWCDRTGVTHSVVRRILYDKLPHVGRRVMVTRCNSHPVRPRDNPAFGEIDCMACVAAMAGRVR
jgi:hypothetical protein